MNLKRTGYYVPIWVDWCLWILRGLQYGPVAKIDRFLSNCSTELLDRYCRCEKCAARECAKRKEAGLV